MANFVCVRCGNRWSMKPDKDGLFNGYGCPPCPKCGDSGVDENDYGEFQCLECGNIFRKYGNGGLTFGYLPKCPICHGNSRIHE